MHMEFSTRHHPLGSCKKYACFQVKIPTGNDIHRIGDAFVDNTFLFYILPESSDTEVFTTQQTTDKL